jgi:WD40 repeat protein
MAAVVEGTAVEDAVVLDRVAHDGGITSIDISSDGTLATIALEEQVRLWDISTRELVTEFRTEPPAGIAALAFSPDGSYLLYTDGAVLRRYPADIDELTNLARQLLTRELSVQECETYAIDCD